MNNSKIMLSTQKQDVWAILVLYRIKNFKPIGNYRIFMETNM